MCQAAEGKADTSELWQVNALRAQCSRDQEYVGVASVVGKAAT